MSGWRFTRRLPPCQIVRVAWAGNCLAGLWSGPGWGRAEAGPCLLVEFSRGFLLYQFLWLATNQHKFSNLKQLTFIISRFLWVGHPGCVTGPLFQHLPQSCSQGVSQGRGLTWGSAGGRSTSQLPRLSAGFTPCGLSDWGPWFLAGCWPETSLCSSLFGALHGAAFPIRVSQGEHLDKEPTGKTERMTPHNVITEGTAHPLSYPLVRHKSQVPHTFREVGGVQGTRIPESKDS